MSLRRVGGLAAVALATLICISCGQVYRPVVLPVSTTPPNPGNFHAVFGINANVPYNQGTAMQIDVSGDTNIGVANMGVNPTHAAILPNLSRVFVASAGSLNQGDADVVTAFTEAFDSSAGTGLGPPLTFTLPNYGAGQSSNITNISESGNLVTVTLNSALLNAAVGGTIVISGVSNAGVSVPGYNGGFQMTFVNGTTIQYMDPIAGLPMASAGTATEPLPIFCSYLPSFVATTQTTAVFVANYGAENGPNCNLASTDSVAMLSTTFNTITNLVYMPAGSHPVAMVETPNGQNLYVLTQTNNLVTNLSPTDLSTQATIPVGKTPAWAVSRVDGQRLYVVTQGDGQLFTINTATNSQVPGSPQPVGGAGANFVLYDKSRNRLYVTNPNAGTVYVFDATADPPSPLGTLTIPAPPISASATNCATYTCAYSSVMPVSVAALPDGSRFYVVSYVTGTATSNSNPPTCPDLTVTTPGCVIPQVTVYDAATLAVKTSIFPVLTAATATGTSGFALAPVAYCAPVFPLPYTPASPRFRMFAAAAADGSRVYASLCDGGSVAIVNTTTSSVASGQNNAEDTLVLDLPTPFSAASVSTGQPPTQNPLFLLTGQ
ncbi:MAG TPA: hypothetical protein VJ999_13850 [Candidatus Sulfotelmatobacter sp.]|nr:hypothetical protein [Candidatus Sulfotelmatobacter sp.]